MMSGMASPSPADRRMEAEPLLKKNDDLMVAPSKGARIRGNKHDTSKNSWTALFLFFKLTLTPMIIFSLVSIIFMLCYHSAARLLMTIDAFFILVLLFTSYTMYCSYYTVEAFMYVVLAFALFSGGLSGTSIHLSHLSDYWTFQNKRHYTNVAPDEPAGAHTDAGVIVFMEGAKPDSTRNTAYYRAGTKYCVAPIAVDAAYADTLAPSSNVQYWAIGEDCCDGKNSFTCSDANAPGARSGLVMAGLSDWDRMIKGIFGTPEFTYYEEAVLMGATKFGLTTPKEHLIMRFVSDIHEAPKAFLKSAWSTWWHTQLLLGVVWITCGIFAMTFAKDSHKQHFSDALTNTMYNINHII